MLGKLFSSAVMEKSIWLGTQCRVAGPVPCNIFFVSVYSSSSLSDISGKYRHWKSFCALDQLGFYFPTAPKDILAVGPSQWDHTVQAVAWERLFAVNSRRWFGSGSVSQLWCHLDSKCHRVSWPQISFCVLTLFPLRAFILYFAERFVYHSTASESFFPPILSMDSSLLPQCVFNSGSTYAGSSFCIFKLFLEVCKSTSVLNSCIFFFTCSTYFNSVSSTNIYPDTQMVSKSFLCVKKMSPSIFIMLKLRFYDRMSDNHCQCSGQSPSLPLARPLLRPPSPPSLVLCCTFLTTPDYKTLIYQSVVLVCCFTFLS